MNVRTGLRTLGQYPLAALGHFCRYAPKAAQSPTGTSSDYKVEYHTQTRQIVVAAISRTSPPGHFVGTGSAMVKTECDKCLHFGGFPVCNSKRIYINLYKFKEYYSNERNLIYI